MHFYSFYNRLKYLDQLLLYIVLRQGGNNLANISQKKLFYYGNILRSLASKLVMGTHWNHLPSPHKMVVFQNMVCSSGLMVDRCFVDIHLN